MGAPRGNCCGAIYCSAGGHPAFRARSRSVLVLCRGYSAAPPLHVAQAKLYKWHPGMLSIGGRPSAVGRGIESWLAWHGFRILAALCGVCGRISAMRLVWGGLGSRPSGWPRRRRRPLRARAQGGPSKRFAWSRQVAQRVLVGLRSFLLVLLLGHRSMCGRATGGVKMSTSHTCAFAGGGRASRHNLHPPIALARLVKWLACARAVQAGGGPSVTAGNRRHLPLKVPDKDWRHRARAPPERP